MAKQAQNKLCTVSIEKKPGNFRPEAYVQITLKASDYPARPYLKGVKLILPVSEHKYSSDSEKGYLSPLGTKELDKWLKKRGLKEGEILLPGPIFEADKPGYADARCDIVERQINLNALPYWLLFIFLLFIGVRLGSVLASFILGSAMILATIIILLGEMIQAEKIKDFFIGCLVNKTLIKTLVPEGYLENDLDISESFYLPFRKGAGTEYQDFDLALEKIGLMLEKQLNQELKY